MSSMTPATGVGPLPWFVSSPHAEFTWDGNGEIRSIPFSTQHARRIGSPLTACGRAASDWRLFSDLAFPQVAANACVQCMRITGASASSRLDLSGQAARTNLDLSGL
jgi:hypothetical protein